MLISVDLPAVIFLGVYGEFINQWSFFRGLQTADPTTPILTGFLAVCLMGFR
ncbi:hypothetical protein [Peribacillus asahii]|uniref:hypothetical protein n=1 Tax=Peribacillus asahii TaxID=228899 RepID=UPI00207A68A0|nr:hypothetical protein [Peribacillus asahii]USK60252.1 hypothetical protein LIT37_02480 [Peribacillus asahii]